MIVLDASAVTQIVFGSREGDALREFMLEGEKSNEAVRLNHSAYDMLHLVLARRTGSTLFTLDKKLQEACIETGVDCVTSMKI